MSTDALRNPIVIFELRSSAAEVSLIQLAETRRSTLSEAEAHEVYVKLREAAQRGSAFAMCICATWRDVRGRSELSPEERYEWARSAAQRGYPPGLCELAFCLQKGIGVQKDLTRAQELYEHSGAAGYGFAAYRLGMAFIQGEYGFIDSQRAVRLMERAYALGEPRGASALAQWFESGERVERDPAAAVSWLERASELGDFTATHRLQLAYMLGDLGLPRDPIKIKEYETRFYEQTEPCTSSVDGSASHE